MIARVLLQYYQDPGICASTYSNRERVARFFLSFCTVFRFGMAACTCMTVNFNAADRPSLKDHHSHTPFFLTPRFFQHPPPHPCSILRPQVSSHFSFDPFPLKTPLHTLPKALPTDKMKTTQEAMICKYTNKYTNRATLLLDFA